MLNYPLLNFCGINLWASNKNNLPFKFLNLYLNSLCMSILPINNIINYKKIKNLYNKMLKVLELRVDQLSKIEIYYKPQQIFSEQEKQSLTEKILIYCPKMIIVFGELEFLDYKLLTLNKVIIKHILHPEHLLSNIKDKVIAYNGLLECKQQLIINV